MTDVEQDSRTDSSRVSVIGLSRMGGLPALTLFNWEQTPTLNTHRFFPLYHYSYNQTSNATTWTALWLYWHQADPQQTRDTFFPLGSVRRTSNEQYWSVSALGVDPVSLVQVSKSPTSTQNRFSPLWDYHDEGQNWGLSFLGIRQFSFFSHEGSADSTTDHLFPLWFRTESPTNSRHLIFPLWSTSENRQIQEQTMSALEHRAALTLLSTAITSQHNRPYFSGLELPVYRRDTGEPHRHSW